jgi:predicted nucleic acid binding AN1-type Zn finger protein
MNKILKNAAKIHPELGQLEAFKKIVAENTLDEAAKLLRFKKCSVYQTCYRRGIAYKHETTKILSPRTIKNKKYFEKCERLKATREAELKLPEGVKFNVVEEVFLVLRSFGIRRIPYNRLYGLLNTRLNPLQCMELARWHKGANFSDLIRMMRVKI